MAFSKVEAKHVKILIAAFVEQLRPPTHLRHQVDVFYRIKGQSVEIFHIRQHLLDPTRKIESSIAKVTYVKAQGIWKLYWLRANMKWHRYDYSGIETLEEAFSIVKADKHGCFFG